MGIIDMVPILGTDFAEFFPLILIVFCAMNYFNIYGKFLNGLGINQLSFSDNHSEEKLQEGKQLIQRARVDKERELSIKNLKAQSGNMNYELTKAEHGRGDPRKPA